MGAMRVYRRRIGSRCACQLPSAAVDIRQTIRVGQWHDEAWPTGGAPPPLGR
jgi:hypothetical protein